MKPLNKPPSLYTFFRLLILIKIQTCFSKKKIINKIKIQTFVYCFSSGFQNPFSLWIQGTLVDSRLFSEANVLCFLFSRNRRILLLDTSASRIFYKVCIIVPIHDTLSRKTKKWLTNMNLIKPVRQVYLLYRKLLGALT